MAVKLVLMADYLKVNLLPQAMVAFPFPRACSAARSGEAMAFGPGKGERIRPPPIHPFSFRSFILPLSLLKLPFFYSSVRRCRPPLHPFT